MTGRTWQRVGCLTALCVVTSSCWALEISAAAGSVGATPTATTAVTLAMVGPATVAMVAPANVARDAANGTIGANTANTVNSAANALNPSAKVSGTGTGAGTATGTGAAADLTPLPVPPSSAEAAPASSPSASWLSLRPHLSMRLPMSAQDWRSAAAATESRFKSLSLPEIKLVELPREPSVIGPPPKRAHHAISVGMEAPKQFLRSMGLEATECATRFRLPSKLGKSQNGDTTFEVSAHLGLGCKF
ncbi:hypothetical protein [Roseateles terrae]|uniref:Uncharacterized protein n=1 Tax=Roseateles terrae TaxID=431060 RepID=A0ABR6GTW0_9BURK|nr:hypothetical protein [Roseateles terrae]MBB3195544.1 hypothetical protein [Roseateles terrae]